MPEENPTPTPPKPKAKFRTARLSYGMTVNIGDFENVRFDFTVDIEPNEDWRNVLDALRERSLRLKKRIQDEKC